MKIVSNRESGLSLIYAMLALAALAVASVALVRSVSTSALVAGNLSFQQDARVVGDRVVRVVVGTLTAKLTASSSSLDADDAANMPWYHSSLTSADSQKLDVTGTQYLLSGLAKNQRILVNWDADYCAQQGAAGTDYASCSLAAAYHAAASEYSYDYDGDGVVDMQANYVVFRLCESTGDSKGPNAGGTNNCAYPLSASSNTSGNQEVRDYAGGAGTSAQVLSPYYRVIVRVRGARNTFAYVEALVHF